VPPNVRRSARAIALTDGRTLATLRCAAECLIATFDGISHWPALEHARDLLMTTAETASARMLPRRPIKSPSCSGNGNFSVI
jgi:hypothetical protein